MTRYVGLDVSQKRRRSVSSTIPVAGCGAVSVHLIRSRLSAQFAGTAETGPASELKPVP